MSRPFGPRHSEPGSSDLGVIVLDWEPLKRATLLLMDPLLLQKHQTDNQPLVVEPQDSGCYERLIVVTMRHIDVGLLCLGTIFIGARYKTKVSRLYREYDAYLALRHPQPSAFASV